MKPKRIPRDEWSRNPARILELVHAGNPVVVDEPGQTGAAIVDLVDYQILLAVIHYYTLRPWVDQDAGLADSAMVGETGQSRFDIVVAHYLAEAISLSRAASALGTSWIDLRTRFSRLGVPVRTGPVDAEGALQDAAVAESLAS